MTKPNRRVSFAPMIVITPQLFKTLRTSRGWSQRKMADELGISQATVTRMEGGSQEIRGPVEKLLRKMIAEDIAEGRISA